MKSYTEPQLANSLWTRAPPQPSYSARGWAKHANAKRDVCERQAGRTISLRVKQTMSAKSVKDLALSHIGTGEPVAFVDEADTVSFETANREPGRIGVEL